MKKWFRILVALAVFGVLAAALLNKFYINKPHADIEKAKPAYEFVVGDLWHKYNSNLKTADSLYNGQVIQLTGKLGRAEENDSTVVAVFIIEEDSLFGDKSIRCEMLPKYNAEIKSLIAGKLIKVKGYCNGYDQTDIKLSKCSLVK